MDWEAAARRHDPATVEGRLWAGLQRLIAARRATRAIHVQGVVEPIWTGNDHVFGLCRAQAGERLLVLANFTADPQPVGLGVLGDRGFALTDAAAEPDGRGLESLPGLPRARALPAPVVPRRFPGFRATLSGDEPTTQPPPGAGRLRHDEPRRRARAPAEAAPTTTIRRRRRRRRPTASSTTPRARGDGRPAELTRAAPTLLFDRRGHAKPSERRRTLATKAATSSTTPTGSSAVALLTTARPATATAG